MPNTPPPPTPPAGHSSPPAAQQRSAAADPARALPLRWGRFDPRLFGGALAIALGTAAVLFTSTYSLPFLAVGMLLQAAGWIVLPASGWRRLSALGPGLLSSALMLAGADFAVFAVVPLAGWLLVRQRPPLAWLLLALPLGTGVVCGLVFTSYEQNWMVFALSGAAVLAGARLSRMIPPISQRRSASLDA